MKLAGGTLSRLTRHTILLAALLPAMQAGAQINSSPKAMDGNSAQTVAPTEAAEAPAPKAEVVVQPLHVQEAFHLRGDAASVINQVLAAYHVTATIDAKLPSGIIRFDTDEVDYDGAAALLRLATNTLFQPLETQRVLVLADTQENRTQRVHQSYETLHLPGLTAQELADIVNCARLLFDVRVASAQPAQGTVTLVGSPSRLQILNQTIAETWRGQSEIAVDLRLTEVDRSATRDIGIKLPQSSTVFNVDSELNSLIKSNSSAVSAIISSGLASANDTSTIAAILIEEGYGSGVLTDPFAVFGNGLTLTGVTFGTLTAELSLSSSDTRSLKHSQTIIHEGESAQLKVGSRYPVKTSQYTVTNYSTSGTVSSTSTTPQIQYQDLGLVAKVTPLLQDGDRIKMKLELNVQGLAGSTINGLPVMTNRKMSTEFSVADGGTAMVMSLLSRQETQALNDVPVLGTTTSSEGDHEATEIVLTVVPRIVYKARYGANSVVRMIPLHE